MALKLRKKKSAEEAVDLGACYFKVYESDVLGLVEIGGPKIEKSRAISPRLHFEGAKLGLCIGFTPPKLLASSFVIFDRRGS